MNGEPKPLVVQSIAPIYPVGFWLEEGLLFIPSKANGLSVNELPPFLEGAISNHLELRDWFHFTTPLITYLEDWGVHRRFIIYVDENDLLSAVDESQDDPYEFYLQTRHPFSRVVPKQGVSLFHFPFLYSPDVEYVLPFVVVSPSGLEAYRILVGYDPTEDDYDRIYFVERFERLELVGVCADDASHV